VRVAGQRLDVERLGLLAIDAVADAAQSREVAKILRRRRSGGHPGHDLPRTTAILEHAASATEGIANSGNENVDLALISHTT